MVDFSHLKKLEITRETTREYIFADIEGEPSVVLAPANDANRDFLDARVRLSVERAEKAAAEPRGKVPVPKLTPEAYVNQLEEERETDRMLLAHSCIRDWGTAPVDAKGKAVEFSAENAYEFLKQLPDYMLDPLRNFAANIYNFIPRPKPDGEKLGNS